MFVDWHENSSILCEISRVRREWGEIRIFTYKYCVCVCVLIADAMNFQWSELMFVHIKWKQCVSNIPFIACSFVPWWNISIEFMHLAVSQTHFTYSAWPSHWVEQTKKSINTSITISRCVCVCAPFWGAFRIRTKDEHFGANRILC